jgi:hypothetical protein
MDLDASVKAFGQFCGDDLTARLAHIESSIQSVTRSA